MGAVDCAAWFADAFALSSESKSAPQIGQCLILRGSPRTNGDLPNLRIAPIHSEQKGHTILAETKIPVRTARTTNARQGTIRHESLCDATEPSRIPTRNNGIGRNPTIPVRFAMCSLPVMFLSANETVEKLRFLFRAYYSGGSKHKEHLRIARFTGILRSRFSHAIVQNSDRGLFDSLNVSDHQQPPVLRRLLSSDRPRVHRMVRVDHRRL